MVLMQANIVVIYGEGLPAAIGRVSEHRDRNVADLSLLCQIYLLYTGTHYDALVGVETEDLEPGQGEVCLITIRCGCMVWLCPR